MGNALERGLHILEYMLANDHPSSLDELSNDLDIPRTSCFRILKSLEKMRYIQLAKTKDRTQKWELTYKLSIFTEILDDQLNLLARPIMEELASEVNLFVQLGILFNDKVMYIDDVKLSKKLRVYAAKWSQLDIHACAAGLVMAAHLSKERINEILEVHGLPKLTKNTITNKSKFFDKLKEVKEQEYAVDLEYYARGIKCVASPVFNHRGENVAAIGVTGHSEEFNNESLPFIIEKVKESARKLSNELGYNDYLELV